MALQGLVKIEKKYNEQDSTHNPNYTTDSTLKYCELTLD